MPNMFSSNVGELWGLGGFGYVLLCGKYWRFVGVSWGFVGVDFVRH